ncbi:phage head closure protein [Pasteurella sp. PK-2025]|uniref:phage head closure protein n=1 Tax=unclassified Pasteurella TaxID=2621516 RepID=UPI003C77F92C
MNIGKLRHRITLQKQVNTLNEYGAAVTKWGNVATIWAEIKPLAGREYFSAQQVQSEITTQIFIRYLPGVLPTMRVKFGSRFFEIISVINANERNIYLQLMCKEKIDG